MAKTLDEKNAHRRAQYAVKRLDKTWLAKQVAAAYRWRDANPERHHEIQLAGGRAYKARMRANEPKRWSMLNRKWSLSRNYGITVEYFLALFENQEGLCGMCSVHMCLEHPKCDRRCHIDHDHATGKVRGLLCHNCNLALGHLKDNVATIRNAVAWVTP